MAHQFNMALRTQEEWSWLLSIDLFLGGIGGGLFVLSWIFHLAPAITLLAPALVMLGACFLFAELGYPFRAWRAIARPQSSWVSRGVIFVVVFVVSGSLYVLPAFARFSWLPWGGASLAGHTLGIIAAITAILVMLYPGFILSASPSIPFWNSPLLPVLFSSHSLMAASGIVLLLYPVNLASSARGLATLTVVLILLNVVLIAIYISTLKDSSIAAKEAVRRLNDGALGLAFRFGVVLGGLVLPLIVIVWLPAAAALAGVLILVGALLLRYCVLRAGVYVPFALG